MYGSKAANIVLTLLFIAFLPLDFRISAGMLIGLCCAMLDYLIIIRHYTRISHGEKPNPFLSIHGYLVLCLPLVISFLLPSIFHFAGVLIGLLYHRYLFMASHFFKGNRK